MAKYIEFNQNELVKTLEEIQDMCNNVLILYKAHAKGNQELTDLGNMTYYILWNFAKSLIALKHFQNATLNLERDFATGELCVTINECIKHVIGFKTFDGNIRKKSLWIKEMGKYILKHPEQEEKYNALKAQLVAFADNFEKGHELEVIRNIATHGDTKINVLLKLHTTSISNIIKYLDGWGNLMLLVANFAFMCFENECQQVINMMH
jgi:hypothetical protein